MKSLPKRWHAARLNPQQYAYVTSKARMNVVVAGRRSFKTEGAKRRVVWAAITFNKYPDGQFFVSGPTHQQAKNIFWEDIKKLVPTWALKTGDNRSIREGNELSIELVNGAKIRCVGLDRPQRIEGGFWDGGVITEFGNTKPDLLSHNIRPMLTRGGWIDIEGVPEGRNHYYDLAQQVLESVKAKEEGKTPELEDVAYHHWTTEETLHLWLGKDAADAELRAAKASMDALTYDQEYRARFVSFEGRAYYCYDEDIHSQGAVEGLRYHPDLPLILCFDFNRSPGVCAYIQEIPRERLPWLKNPAKTPTITACIGEIYIKRNSNTLKVCDRIKTDWQGVHNNVVYLYGDPAGGAKTSSAVKGSDWDLIEQSLKPVWGSRLKNRVAKSAPSIRARLNSVNARLKAADDSIGMVVQSTNAPNIAKDFEGVETNEAGELLKVAGDPLTHLSDAIGYYVHAKWPLGRSVLSVQYC